MTEDDDLKDFEECWSKKFDAPDEVKISLGYLQQKLFYKEGFIEGRRTLREKINMAILTESNKR